MTRHNLLYLVHVRMDDSETMILLIRDKLTYTNNRLLVHILANEMNNSFKRDLLNVFVFVNIILKKRLVG